MSGTKKKQDRNEGLVRSARLDEIARRRLPPDTLDLIEDTKEEVVEIRIGSSRGAILSLTVNPAALKTVVLTLMTVSGWAWGAWGAIREQPMETARAERTAPACRGLPPSGAE